LLTDAPAELAGLLAELLPELLHALTVSASPASATAAAVTTLPRLAAAGFFLGYTIHSFV
jgi:hypothetical protein